MFYANALTDKLLFSFHLTLTSFAGVKNTLCRWENNGYANVEDHFDRQSQQTIAIG